jgi:hypothetical protein
MTKIISHRGNLNGPKSCKENDPKWIDYVISLGYDVEVDLWYDKGFYLGHDSPQYKINKEWIEKNNKFLWVHCKNKEALHKISELYLINYFWHESDEYTLTSKSYVWVYPNSKLLKYSVCVLPEKGINGNIKECYAICTDFAEEYKKGIKND